MNAKMQRLLLLVAIGLGIAVVAGLVCAGDDKDDAPKAADPFAGKIMLVHLDAEMEVLTGILTGLEIKEVHGRKFLVGVGVPTGQPADWWAGRKVFVSWEKVTGYLLLSKEEFEEYLDSLKDRDAAA